MKTGALFLGLVASTFANIIFNHVPLHCNLTSEQLYHGCLRGQKCTESGACVPIETLTNAVSLRADTTASDVREYSTDGSCGPSHGDTICDPNSTVYTGRCCSQDGQCGNTPFYCGAGCISGCTGTPPPVNSGTAPHTDGRCGKDFGDGTCDQAGPGGGCCSSYGFCGSTPGHCLISNGCQNGCSGTFIHIPSPTITAKTARSDGRCGKDFDGATCNPSGPYGSCCSGYGFCGSTLTHCLASNGCQNGCTDTPLGNGGNIPSSTSQEPVITAVSSTMAAEATATALATVDGTCGTSNGNTVCGSWTRGNCCSLYGFCGNTTAHCGAGCQSGNCLKILAVQAPGESPAPHAPIGGSFNVVGQSGVPAMHAGLMPNGQVFFLDKLENYTQLQTADGYYAMSSEYDPDTNTVVPLTYSTNAFCSGGAFLADGRVISVGGNGPLTWLNPNIADGFTAIRYLQRSSSDPGLNGQSWNEPGNKLASARWYATAQTMPDGSIFVASGSLNGLDPTDPANNNPTYEILSRDAVTEGNNIPMEILHKNQPYYMYPFIHLLNDGTLFVFVCKSSQVFNVSSNSTMKELQDLPGDYRTYPTTGGSVLLPLSSKNNWAPDIVICGGGVYQDITSPTDPSCGRIQPLSDNPHWEMDSMPEGRGMVEGILLPDGTVLWMNGGNQGAQGFGLMSRPTSEALLYDPAKPLGQRFTTLARSLIPRLYHSVALLLLDGTVMVAGSNPVQMPKLQPDGQDPFVTEFRVENYVPPYLQGDNANRRPTDILIPDQIPANGSQFFISFHAPDGAKDVKVVLYHGGFVTHSLHMGHRMLQLDFVSWKPHNTEQILIVTAPPNRNVAPPGPYVVYVVCDGVPGIGQFVQVG